MHSILAGLRGETVTDTAGSLTSHISGTATQVGGRWQKLGKSDLEQLRPGWVTPVWVQTPAGPTTPAAPMNLVLVERLADGRLVQIETVQGGPSVRTELDPAVWQRRPGTVVRVVRAGDTLGQLNASGVIVDPTPPAVSLSDGAPATSRRSAAAPSDPPKVPATVPVTPATVPVMPATVPATPATVPVMPVTDPPAPVTDLGVTVSDSPPPGAGVIAGGWTRTKPGRFEADNRASRWRRPPNDTEREKLRVVSAQLWDVSDGTQRPHKELVGLAGQLREVGALRDLHGGAHRGEMVLSRLGSDKTPRDVAEQSTPDVRSKKAARRVAGQLMLHVRSKTGKSEVLGSVDRAVRGFVAQPGIMQVGELQGEVLTVGVPPEGSEKVVERDLQRIPVDVVDPGQWDLPTHTSVRLVEGENGPTLQVRGDASDASITIGVAGELNRWAYQRRSPQTSVKDLQARSLLAQHEAVRRLYFQGRRFGLRRAKRWVKASTGWLKGAGQVVHGEWTRIDSELRQLVRDQDQQTQPDQQAQQTQRDQQGQQGQQGVGLSEEVRQQVDSVVRRRRGSVFRVRCRTSRR